MSSKDFADIMIFRFRLDLHVEILMFFLHYLQCN